MHTIHNVATHLKDNSTSIDPESLDSPNNDNNKIDGANEMKRSHLLGALGATLSAVLTVSAHAALIGVLPATPAGTDWQAYYDDRLDITWTANANINGSDTWDNQVAWAAGLDIDGVTGWRLPSMDVNGDGTIVDCTAGRVACKDNEYGHLFNYGAGTVFGAGITASNPGPFSNVQSSLYWSSTEFAANPTNAWVFYFGFGNQSVYAKPNSFVGWAVHSGKVSAVPIPAVAWLFGSGLTGWLGWLARRRH